nr:site-specific integrase [Clostridia bacterium]
REEIVGLTWDEIDFENNCFTIRNTVKQVNIDGKHELVIEKKTKNQSSCRTMPLNHAIKEKLLLLKKKQEENRKICGDCYNHEFDGFVFVDPMGDLYKPNYVYSAFKIVLKEHGFKDIRFHDLRHSCASLMVTKGEGINNVQKWVGHSDIGTTANIYAHLDFQSKVESAEKMSGILTIPDGGTESDWS